MTALQDWLGPPLDAFKAFICVSLRGMRDKRTEVHYEPVRLRPGVERC